MLYVITRNKKKHFKRRIPKAYRANYPESVEFVQISLNTDSEKIAQQRATELNRLLEQQWQQNCGQTVQGRIDIADLALISQSHGFNYKSAAEISESDLREIVNRLAQIDTQAQSSEQSAALLGHKASPALPISMALEQYMTFEQPNLRHKSDNQLRKWRNPRMLAVKNFVSICGDKGVLEITREDILQFRSWWQTRLEEENLGANAANKNLSHLKSILTYAEDNHYPEIKTNELFKRIRFRETKNSRPPFSTSFIRNTLLEIPKLKGLSPELQWFLFAMADTGARVSELVGLNPRNGDIRLDTTIPYISIRPENDKQLKTPQSEREIPLVGASLKAFQNLPNGFETYYRKPDLLSSSLNKFLREHDLLPTSGHSVYSLRHSFEDRLTAVEPPDKVQAALMGHKYNRPRYGDGPSLEQKKKWLDKIAFIF